MCTQYLSTLIIVQMDEAGVGHEEEDPQEEQGGGPQLLQFVQSQCIEEARSEGVG